MAEDKKANPYPYPTAEEVAAAPGERGIKAARNIATRRFEGIPGRAFLLGSNDHSPMLRGIADLAELCYRILDEFEPNEENPLLAELRDMLADHRCKPATAEVEE